MADVNTAATDRLPLPALFKILLRWLPAIVAVGALSGLGAYSFLDSAASAPESKVTLGLTNAVRWPFYEPARGRLALGVDEALVEDVRAELGDNSINLRASVPESLAIVEVFATASTDASARDGADLAATLVLERNNAARIVEAQVEIVASQVEITRLQADLDTNEAALEELFSRRATTNDSTPLRRIDDEISTITRQRDNDLQARLNLEAAVTAAEVQVNSLQPEATIVGRSLAGEEGNTRRIAMAFAVGLAGSILAALVALIVSSERGKAQSPNHLALMTERDVKRWPTGDSAGLLRWLAARIEPDERIGVVGADGRPWAQALWDSIETTLPAERLPALADITKGSPIGLLLKCDSAIVVASAGVSVSKVREALSWLDDNEIPILGVLYRDDDGTSKLAKSATAKSKVTPAKTDGENAAETSEDATASVRVEVEAEIEAGATPVSVD